MMSSHVAIQVLITNLKDDELENSNRDDWQEIRSSSLKEMLATLALMNSEAEESPALLENALIMHMIVMRRLNIDL